MGAKPKTKLTDREERFCREYVKDLCMKHAAIRAGYSAKSAETQSSKIMDRPMVKERVQELLQKQNSKLELTAERVLLEIMRLAFVDLGDAYDDEGQLLPVKEMPEDVRRALQGVDIHKDFTEGVEIGETKKVKIHDKRSALELLARNLKLLTDKVEVSGSLSLAERIKKARENLKK